MADSNEISKSQANNNSNGVEAPAAGDKAEIDEVTQNVPQKAEIENEKSEDEGSEDEGSEDEGSEDEGSEDEGPEAEESKTEEKETPPSLPPTPEILEWKAKMESMISPNSIVRIYFEDGPTAFAKPTEKPVRPETIDSSDIWYSNILLPEVEPGSYELVFCVSLKDLDWDLINSITFDCRSSQPVEDGIYFELDQESETKVEKEELLTLPKSDFARLRFFRQINYEGDETAQYLTIQINTVRKLESLQKFQLHYLEIQHSQYRSTEQSTDHVVFGSGKPDLIVSAGPNNPSPEDAPVEIMGFDISDTGDYAATLYFQDEMAYLDVWDLRSKRLELNDDSTKQPQVINRPFAQAKFPLEDSDFVNIDISSTGSQVVVFGLEGTSGIPFLRYKTVPAAPADKDLSLPWKLEKAETICDGNYYFTTSFYRSDLTNTDEEAEKCFVSDGCTFSVYNIQDNWTLIYSIDIQDKLDLRTANVPYTSIQGNYFAWITAIGVVTVWNFETGKLVSHIFTGAEHQIGNPCLSPDGSMIAIPVKNTIQIRDTHTGVKLGVYNKNLSNDGSFEVVFGNEFFMTYDTAKSTVRRLGAYDARSIVNVRDLQVVNTVNIHVDYHVDYPQNIVEPIFFYNHGPNLNIKKLGNILSPPAAKKCGVDIDCPRSKLEILDFFPDSYYPVTNKAGEKFIITSSLPFKRDMFITEIGVSFTNENGTKKNMKIPLGCNDVDYQGIFVPGSSQLVLISGGYVQLWTLSATDPQLCELDLIWKFEATPEEVNEDDSCEQTINAALACEHGTSIRVDLDETLWYKAYTSEEYDTPNLKPGTLTIPITKEDTFPLTVEERHKLGFHGLIPLYIFGEEDCKEAVVRYIEGHLHPTLKNTTECLLSIISCWKPQLRLDFQKLISKVLPTGNVTWIPEIPYNKKTDPLAAIIEVSKTHPTAITVAKVIMNYCTSRAARSRNLAFLGPFFGSLHEVMEIVPEQAFECLYRIAFIPVMHRSYIVDNCIIAYPPKFHLKFWEPVHKPLALQKDPIMQLDIISDAADSSNDKFTRPVFMASFDALWHYAGLDSPETKKNSEIAESSNVGTTTWWKTLYHMIRLKSRLRIHNYVECYDFDIEFFDNPAIAALVAYKWNTLGFYYWLVRFVFQCCFYALVIIAALMQVYYRTSSDKLVGLFIAIIVFSVAFLWLELLQAVRSVQLYTKSGYNFLDVIAFGIPLAASIDQIVVIYQQNSTGNTRLLSYSVLIVFIHMLFELRINKSVCKYVTIIQQAVIEIRVFFFILAGGIIAFTISIMHLFWSCPYGDCPDPTTNFPQNFIGALSSTYFFMGGRLDPITDNLNTHDWGFHLMMAIYFFLTVILMLNVLIALINVAFTKGDDGWRLVWVSSRLRFIESAENMSYHIPGFRQTHNWFPKEIYFTATLQQVRNYREKYSKDNNEADLDITEDWLRGDVDIDGFVDEDVYDGPKDTKSTSTDAAKKTAAAGTEVAKANVEGQTPDSEVDKLKVSESESLANKTSPVTEVKTPDGNTSTPDVNAAESSSSISPTAAVAPAEEKAKDDASVKSVASLPLDNNTDKVLIQGLNQQVGDLKTQVADLQKQLSEQVLAQKEQAQKQFEELKNLLLQREY